MKKETKRMAIIAGCNEIWSATYGIRLIVSALRKDISELSTNKDFKNLYDILDEAIAISNCFIVIARKDELQLNDDEETEVK